jgi:glycosyltransferase involved in cell wall biosynthesis
MTRLSVVVPIYNEETTVEHLLAEVGRCPLPQEIDQVEVVTVDDGSADRSWELVKSFTFAARDDGVELSKCLYRHQQNQGKGAALRTGLQQSTGDIILIQDADLEYDPHDYPTLLQPILSGQADVVYGSRFLGGPHRVLFFWHYVGNKLLTIFSNMLTDLNLTDMETCYKVFTRKVLDSIRLTSNRFGFEPEFTARVAQLRCRVYEVAVSYHGRTYQEGKKIGWRDGFEAIWCILKFNLLVRNRNQIASNGQAADDKQPESQHD